MCMLLNSIVLWCYVTVSVGDVNLVNDVADVIVAG